MTAACTATASTLTIAAPTTWATATPSGASSIVIVDGNRTEQLVVSGYSAGAVTLAATTTYSHPIGTYVYFQAAGTAPAAFVPVTKIDAQDNIAMLGDKGFRGSMASEYGVQQGMREGKLSFDGDFFADTVGYWLNSLFGFYAYTAGTPYVYAFSQANTTPTASPGQPAPLLVYVYNPVSSTTRVYARCVVDSFSLKVDPGSLMSYAARIMAFASGVVTHPTTVPPAFSTFTPVASRVATMSINGSATAKVLSADYAWKRDSATAINTLQGIQDPLQNYVGPLDLSIKAKIVPSDDTELNLYLNGTQVPMVLTAVAGTGAAATGITVQNTLVNINDANVTRDKAYVEIDLDIDALANSTDVASGAGGLSSSKVTLSTAATGTATQYGKV
jgi:hypothetical protein